MRLVHSAGALLWREADDALLLIKQKGPHDRAAYWALPGGRVENGELLLVGLYREVREETGIQITQIGELIYTARLIDRQAGYQAHARIFAVQSWTGTLQVADPDQLIEDVAFVPRATALARLEGIPWRVMREPLLAYLRGEVARGCVWLYNQEGEAEPTLIKKLPGPQGA